MRRALGVIALLNFPWLVWAQAPPADPDAGLTPDWDISVVLGEMSDHAARLGPTLDRIDAKAWVAKGASETYEAQLQSAKDQARAIATDAKALARSPEKLSACLELFFRVQGMEQMIDSLDGAIRKYQSAELADQLASQSAENGLNRNRFQTYIVSLAAQREQVCAVMDKEAQRCRSVVATQAPATGKKK
jgi:prophage DNA circulation protein